MTHNTESESSDLPNGDAGEAPARHTDTGLPEAVPVISPLPDPPPQHPAPPRSSSWDVFWFW